MVWDIALNVVGSLLPSLLGGGGGGQTFTVPVPKPVIPKGEAKSYQGRTVVPIYTQPGVALRQGYTQAYDTVSGRRIVVAESALRPLPKAPTAPAAPSAAEITRIVQDLLKAIPQPAPATVPKTVQPPQKASPVPTGEIVEFGGKQFAPILTEAGATLAPGARQAIDLTTGKRAVLPASAFKVKSPPPEEAQPPAAVPDTLGALLDFGEAAAKRAQKQEAIEQWAIQRTAAVTRDPLDFGSMVGAEAGLPVVRGRPAIRSPVPVVGGVPARPPINLPAPRLPQQLPTIGTGTATAAGAAGGIAAIIASQGCIPVCEPEKSEKQKEQQRKARLPRKSCRQVLEEWSKACPCSKG